MITVVRSLGALDVRYGHLVMKGYNKSSGVVNLALQDKKILDTVKSTDLLLNIIILLNFHTINQSDLSLASLQACGHGLF